VPVRLRTGTRHIRWNVWKLRVAVAAFVLAATSACVPIGMPSTDPSASPADARRQLTALTVAPAGSMRGYARTRFPTWRQTGNNCNVRDEVLKRDGTKVKTSGCNVVAGTWTSAYDGKVLDAPAKVEIDHLVPLADAWRSGASTWTDARREDFANDLDRPELTAVSTASNRAKGDQDPSAWRPQQTSAWCDYAGDWIAVKAHWKLTVTSAEKTALADMLGWC
jgi:Protein of unknown function (DUF1524)